MQRSSALILVALAGLAPLASVSAPAFAQNIHWNAGTGLWSHGPNWLGGVVPGPANSVFLGSTAAAFNAGVTLDASPTIANLTITDGMGLTTDNRSLTVTGNTLISGSNPVEGGVAHSGMIVDFVDGTAFTTNNLTLEDAGIFLLRGAYTRVFNTMSTQAGTRVLGNGHIWFQGNHINFINEGRIAAGTDEGITLRQLGDGRFNLDGTSGDGRIWLNYFDPATQNAGRLTVEGVGLSDAFSGTIEMRRGSRLSMDLDEGWVADASSVIDVDAGGFSANSAVIEGTDFTFGGRMDIYNPGSLSINTTGFTLASSAVVNLDGNSGLTTGSSNSVFTEVIMDGATFNAAPDANVWMYDHVTVRGGTYNSDTSSWGSLTFFDDTTWDGDLTVHGRLRNFNGNASVVGPTVITADEFMMGDADSHWSVANTLVINADSLTYGAFNGIEGEMSITGTATGRLTMNLTDPNQSWEVGGRLRVGGLLGSIPVTRVAGNHMFVTGELAAEIGIARITADATFADSSSINIASPATLRMQGVTTVESDAVLQGEGWLHNGVDAQLRMEHGASLERVGLINSSDLFIARNAAGQATVDRLESTADARWVVDIRGMLPGLGHDRLIATGGTAQLDGELIVLLDPAPTGFRPEVGDEFTILQASAGVVGTFVNVPGSVLGAVQYGWEVIYSENTVVLRLERIVPTPGAVTLFGLGGVMIARRRRIS